MTAGSMDELIERPECLAPAAKYLRQQCFHDWAKAIDQAAEMLESLQSEIDTLRKERDAVRTMARRYAREFLGGDSLTRALAEIDEAACLSGTTDEARAALSTIGGGSDD